MLQEKSTNPSLPNLLSQSGQQGIVALNISGILLNASSGYPLQDLTVQVYFLEPSPSADTSQQNETLLGSGNSSLGGLYQIVWVASPLVAQRLCLLTSCSNAQFLLKVSAGPTTAPFLVTSPMSASGKSMVVNLSAPIPQETLTQSNWTDIGQRMQTAHIKLLSGLIAQLVLMPSSQSIFKDWPLTLRQSAVTQLETAFLDPQGVLGRIRPIPPWQQLKTPEGLSAYQKSLSDSLKEPEVQQAFDELSEKVGQFAGIFAVDWTVDSTLFQKSPAEAITINQAEYYGPYPLTIPTPEFLLELGYRDYLRTRWTNMITLVEYVTPLALTEQQAQQQLRNRFHQDFTTQDTTTVVANEILIPILTEILTSATGNTFGFGIPTAKIPLRGSATARQYLDTLIGLTGVSAQELSLRYRTDFTRADSVTSDAVWENIYTLQGFFRDSFQSVVDPSHTDPDVLGQPIIPDLMQGKAPYFLEYGEWLLQQQPISFENYFQIRQLFQITVSADTRKNLQNWANTNGPNQALYQSYVGALALQDQLVQAYQYMDQNEYQAALDILGQLPFPVVPQLDLASTFATRKGMSIKSLDDLQKLMTLWHIVDIEEGVSFDQWALFYQTALACSLTYLEMFTLPVISAQALLALGDYPTAILEFGRSAYFLVGKAATSDSTAWRDFYEYKWWGSWTNFPLYHAGNLPYTVDTETKLPGYPVFADDDSLYWGASTASDILVTAGNSQNLIPGGIHPVERLFFRLQMGEAMLEWADTLYRSDDASNIARARELYKGIYYLHGAVPPINPTWDAQQGLGYFFDGYVNPAQASQLTRGKLGFTQIDAGLNFFGYADDMVPILRYSTLKMAADKFTAEAKSAETDFLNAMAQLENATIENMKNSAMLQQANLKAEIAQQQASIAQDQVQQAKILIAQVNQQISTLEQQISDHDSFFGELGDYISGMVGIVKGLPSFFTSGVAAGVGAEAGISSSDTAGLLGLGAGASTMAGFGAFYVASYMTLSSMASAQNQRQSQLSNLEGQNLPSAQAQLDIAQRSVTIADLNQQIAASDAQLATQLLAFAQDRYLSSEFWSYMATLFKRILRQYLDLATQIAWLAQRALSYEQNTDITIIQMDYFPTQEQGVGGADQLQLDLAELEVQYLEGLQEMIPVKYTVSLARDFPLQFAQLLTTGQCIFQTQEQTLQWAYPGTYSYRVIAVTPTLSRTAATSPIRGLLSNGGVSQISASDGSMRLSMRPADALPISEFNLGTTDRQIYGLPGGTLMQFEGSGIETFWKLEFPAAANLSGLSDLADVLFTMNLRAQFSPSLYQTQLQQMPTTISKFILVSAYKQQLSGLADLQGHGSQATIAFDLTAINLPAQEQKRTINNIAVLVIGGKNIGTVKASVRATTPLQTIPITLTNGATFSNNPPITDTQSTVPLSPLNALAGITVNQTLSLIIDKSQNPGVDFSSVQDVLLGVDYNASV
ncbi:MAG TPA: hypothetical protein VKR83_14675 [Ktedonobacteraceae bacterium]|nr:hypothetical protein [Ktedonobacteraceae bacterium]